MAQPLSTKRINLWAAYNRQLTKTPVSTKSITSVIMFIVSQVIAQIMTKGKINSYRKVVDFAIWGALNPLAAHNWQNFLAKYGPSKLYFKLPFDHFLYRFPFLVCFHMYSKMMEGSSFRDAVRWTATNNPGLQILSMKLWPTVNALNYSAVPLRLRVGYQNIVLFGWAVYLSLKEKWVTAAELEGSTNKKEAGGAASAAPAAPVSGGMPNIPLALAICAFPAAASYALPQ